MADSTVNISNTTDTIVKLLKIVDNGDGTYSLPVSLVDGFSLPAYDYISLGYTGDNLTSVVFKLGGSGGTTVATLTLAYSGSNLSSVTKT
jgi:hypothetical protein